MLSLPTYLPACLPAHNELAQLKHTVNRSADVMKNETTAKIADYEMRSSCSEAVPLANEWSTAWSCTYSRSEQ